MIGTTFVSASLQPEWSEDVTRHPKLDSAKAAPTASALNETDIALIDSPHLFCNTRSSTAQTQRRKDATFVDTHNITVEGQTTADPGLESETSMTDRMRGVWRSAS
jgi:hypothetical protein